MPDGYNTMGDLLFSIAAGKLTGENGEQVITVRPVGADGNALKGWTADAAARVSGSDIINYNGSILPSTGGTGIYPFYTVGSAVILLIELGTGCHEGRYRNLLNSIL